MVLTQNIPNSYYHNISLADSLIKANEFEKAALTYHKAFSTLGGKGLPNDRYNAACSWAKAGFSDSAFYNLEILVTKANYSDYLKLSLDRNLIPLYKDDTWAKILNQVKFNYIKSNNTNNVELSLLIDSLVYEDQKWRTFYREITNKEIDTISINECSANIKITDSTNYSILKQIIKNYGYPCSSMVGTSSTHNFWLLVQHQDKNREFQKKVLRLMRKENSTNKPQHLIDYAYLFDRVKINFNKRQVYGTQVEINSDSSSYELKKCIHIKKINRKRKKVGLPPIDDYIKMMNERYFGVLKKE